MSAFALLLSIEGLLPLIAPQFWQKTMSDLSRVNPKTIRIGGIVSMLAGAFLLQFLHLASMNNSIVVLGTQRGDEGKGKIVYMLSRDSDAVFRIQSVNNAGHTLVIDGEKTVLHLIPSGILQPGVECFIGNVEVLTLKALRNEIEKLEAKGL